MNFIKKGWGKDVEALYKMAEALTNIAIRREEQKEAKTANKSTTKNQTGY